MYEQLVKQKTVLLVGVLIIVVLGILATLKIPVQMIPDLDVRVVQIETRWPGASPQDVEQEILIEQERYLRNLPNVTRMTSSASSGSAEIELEFPLGTSVTDALVRVNNALSQVPGYPENVDEPRLEATSFSQNSFIFLRVQPLPGNPDQIDIVRMFDFVDDNVRSRMERIPGVSAINLGGGSERQIRVEVDPVKLAERGITLTDVRDVIRARNRNVSAGRLEAGKRRYLIRTLGRFETLDDFRQLVVKSDGLSRVLLRDVAEVSESYYRMTRYATMDGEQVISLSVDRQPGSNVIDIKNALLPVLDELNAYVLNPAGMEIRLTSDDVRYVQASIKNVWQNLFIGAVLATIVLFAFLRSLPATALCMVGIPLCTLAAFLGLLTFGRTINVISLAGIAFALGMTLDNSIVVLEAIDKRRRAGVEAFRAAIDSVRQVWPAILASTATTIIVFAPVFFIRNEAGQLYSDIAIAISSAIIASMVVAVVVVPTLSTWLPMATGEQARPAFGTRLVAFVGRLIESSRRRLAVLALTVAGIISAVWWLTPPAAYLPEGEEPKTFARMIAPPGYNLTEMRAIAEQVTDYFVPHVNADEDAWRAGKTDVPPLAYFRLIASAETLFVIAETIAPGDIGALTDVLSTQFRSYPGMRAFASRGSIISSNRGGSRSVNLDITGPDLEQIYTVARSAVRRAEQVFINPQIGSSPSSLSIDQPFIEIRPDWSRAAELGFSAGQLGFSVAALSDGAFVDEFLTGDEKIDIFIYSTDGASTHVADLADLPLHAPVGEIVPLSSVARLEETVDLDEIRRVNGRRTVTLNVGPPRGVPLEAAVAKVRTEIVQAMSAAGEIPSQVAIDISGASDQLSATKRLLAENYLIALLLCYLVMVAVFNHWGWPLVILTTVPLGIAGGIVGLTLLNGSSAMLRGLGAQLPHQPFDMITMLGFLILLGLVLNNPILIIHRMLQNLAEGQAATAAVLDAVRTRVRPIMMSLITTLFGLAPLVFIPGAGTELYRGVGAVVLFGLLIATTLSLTFLPVLLVVISSLRNRFRQQRLGKFA